MTNNFEKIDEETVIRWNQTDSEKLRYDYDLNKDSICIDLGAFHCDWSVKLSEMHDSPKIYAFEPVKDFYDIGFEKIKNYNNIKLFNYGISNKNFKSKIKISSGNGAGTSLYINSNNVVDIEIKSIKDVLEELNIKKIDLIKINIEGSEYDVLECLIENNIHKNIKNMQVQFHRLGEDYLKRYNNIKKNLLKTHTMTYHFSFIWENWELNE